MRFLTVAPLMVAIFWSSNVASAPDDDWRGAFPEAGPPRGVFKWEGSAPGGLTRGTYTPYDPEPMWKRARVFIPSIRRGRESLALFLVTSTVPAYFFAKRYYNAAP